MQLIRSALRKSMAAVQNHAQILAKDTDNTEAVHQVRVGLRRLRTVLRDLVGVYSDVPPEWEVQLAQAFRLLGARRDADILNQVIRPILAEAGSPLTAAIETTSPDVQAILFDAQLQKTLLDIDVFAHGLKSAPQPSQRKVERWVGKRLHRLQKQVLSEGRHFERLTTDRQHRIRKRLKRLAYLSEWAVPLWPDRKTAIKAHLARLKSAQDALGFHHDLVVATQHLMSRSDQEPNARFAAGYLKGYMKLTARDAQEAIRGVEHHALRWMARGS